MLPREKTIESYREEGEKHFSNLLKSCRADEHALALRVLRTELETGDVEFFCGSGVGRDVTGVDWVGLVNLGAAEVLSSKLSSCVDGGDVGDFGVETALKELAEFQLLQTCYKAYGPAGSDAERDAVVKSFNGSFLDFVMDYADAVDKCLVRAASSGFDCPKTYNVFIAGFMSECHARAACPASLPRSIGAAIARHSPHGREHSVYTTNYSRSVNFALLEQGLVVEEIFPVRMGWQRLGRDSSAYSSDMRVARSVLYPVKPAADPPTVVHVFHLHGIAKAQEEFENPSEPGPKGRPETLWARQEHFDLGSAEDLMEGEDISASLLEPWGRASDSHKYRPGLLSGGRRLEGAEAADLFEAAAEGIVITRAQYGCKAHSEVLKGSFRLAMDDVGRTMCLVGCSMSDEFFERFLNENLDANDEDEAGLGEGCQGITMQLGVSGVRSMMDGDDVKAELKPYLLFFLGQTSEGKRDFDAIKALIESSSAA